MTVSGDDKKPLSADQKKHFRQIGHHLNPVVTIAGNGLSEAVLEELNRALRDHELIKIKLAVNDREAREAILLEACRQSDSIVVQKIGKVALLYRANPKPDPRLSNLLR
ncbi:MAG: YhbY family RNA-binding protein [bacterium]